MNQAVSHFPQALKINQHLPKLLELYQRYEKDPSKINQLAVEAKNFTVRLPLVGAFSCGKTTLINALIAEKLFAVEVNPETALPVELSYSPQREFIGHTPEGRTQPLTHEAVIKQQFEGLLPNGWLEARLPAAHLQTLSQLTLVDMPGWESGIDQHSRAIDSYLHRSLAYCLVVSADEGNLRESLRAFAQELAVRKMPALVVITKADKKPQQDVDAVQQQVTQEVTKILGQPPLGVVQVSARKRQIQSFVELLNALQSRADERFSAAIVQPLLTDLAGLVKRLETLCNQDNLNEEGLQAKREELEREMQAFEDRVRMETANLDAQINPAITNILRRVEGSLLAQLDSLASQAASGGDIKGSIGSSVRLALSEGVQEEFAPKLRRYFERIEQDIPNSLNINTNIRLDDQTEKKEDNFSFDMSSLQNVLQTILPMIMLRLTGPIGAVVSVAVTLIAGILGSFFGKGKADGKVDPVEQVKSQIVGSIIPQVKSQVSETLSQHLKSQAEEAKKQILATTQEQSQQHQASLDQLSEELRKGREEFNKKRAEYQQDLHQLQEIKSQLLAGL